MALKTYRLGEIKEMNNGYKATIIQYRSKSDMDIQFENGIVRKSVRYDHFKEGRIDFVSKYKKQESQKQNRVGETRMMSCGINATILEYHKANEITVQFEDGAIRENTTYNCFLRGGIAHPKSAPQKDGTCRIGECKMMRNGMMATIIAYRSSADIDVQFEDGSIVISQYNNFKNGRVPHPVVKYKNGTSLQEFAILYYLRNYGFTKIQFGAGELKKSQQFELDFYNANKNVAIEFDGGFHRFQTQIKRDLHKNQKCLCHGIKLYRLRAPELQNLEDGLSINYTLDCNRKVIDGIIDCKKELEQILIDNKITFNCNDIDFWRDYQTIYNEYNEQYLDFYAKERVGQQIYHNATQQQMMIIAYRNFYDIDIRFDDGYIVEHTNYSQFQLGTIQHPTQTPNAQKSQRLHQKKIMKSGHEATIVQYNNSADIAVRFEDGCLRNKVSYSSFQKGTILHPHSTNEAIKKQRMGEKRKMKNGMNATIIRYGSAMNMDVKFDDGIIKYNVDYARFKEGSIRHPSDTDEKIRASRIGETAIMNSGKRATIIRYKSHGDITVQFEDGKIKEHVSYRAFQIKAIEHPDDTPAAQAKSRIGETRTMNCGKNATIIQYRSATDIDLQFEDGAIVQNKRYTKFQNGQIAHPDNDRKTIRDRRIGESHKMNNGQMATIIDYHSSLNVDVQFEDGTIVTNKLYCNFRRGEIKNPNV